MNNPGHPWRAFALLTDGRGPMRAKTYVLDDIIVVVMRGSGFTPLEQTIMDSGRPDRVVAMREDFQTVMQDRYKQTIKELTGRNVVAFLSQAHLDPDTGSRCSSSTAPWQALVRLR